MKIKEDRWMPKTENEKRSERSMKACGVKRKDQSLHNSSTSKTPRIISGFASSTPAITETWSAWLTSLRTSLRVLEAGMQRNWSCGTETETPEAEIVETAISTLWVVVREWRWRGVIRDVEAVEDVLCEIEIQDLALGFWTAIRRRSRRRTSCPGVVETVGILFKGTKRFEMTSCFCCVCEPSSDGWDCR